MIPRHICYRELCDEEGKKLKVYRDTKGFNTVGIGHLCLPGDGLKLGDHITEERCRELFNFDLDRTITGILDRWPWFSRLPDNQQYVFISLAFNLGIKGLSGFKNTLRNWEEGNIPGVISGLQHSLWYTQVGRRGPKLIDILRNGLS